MLKLTNLRCSHEATPFGITGSPVFSWILKSDRSNVVQVSCRVIIRSDGQTIADTETVRTDQSTEFRVDGFTAEDRKEYTFHVEVTDNYGERAVAESRFEAAPASLEAKWIGPANLGVRPEKKINMAASQLFHIKPRKTPDERLMPVTLMRREFNVRPGLVKARAYATARGIYELSFNGRRPDQRFFAPEFTSYEKYFALQTYDILPLLNEGANVCGIRLADGWYSGRIGMTGECAQFGTKREILLQIELTYEDGSRDIIASDQDFLWRDDGITRYADIFIGEKQDMRCASGEAGFDLPARGALQSGWQPVSVSDEPLQNLHSQTGGAVEVFRELPCVNIITTPRGEKVVDFGQVFAGVVRMEVPVFEQRLGKGWTKEKALTEPLKKPKAVCSGAG